MKVKLLSLNNDKNMPFAKFQARVISSIKNYSEGNETFEHYEKMRDLFEGFQNAFSDSDLIVIAVDGKHYFKFKTAVTQAFEVDSVYDPTVLTMLENDESLTDEERKNFSSFPEPATVFLSKDGMYSGFGLDNGEKYIIIIPIDNDRINIILRNGVVPYLAKTLGGDDSEIVSESHHFNNERVETAVSRLVSSGSVVAVNGTQNAEAIKSYGELVDGFGDVFIFTPHVEDRGEVNVTEYAAQLARVSLDLSAANIGASISDVYETEESQYICIAVADENTATVRKLYLDEGETAEEFIESAALELIDLIGEKAAGIQSIGIEVSDEPVKSEEIPNKKSNKKVLTIITILLSAVILGCAVIAVVVKMQGENGSAAALLRKIFGYETTSTTVPTTVPTTAAPAPVVDNNENRLKISDFMMADIIKLEIQREEEAKNPPQEETESSTEPQTDEEGETVSETVPEVEVDKGAPEFMFINGEKLPAQDAVAGLVMTEMGEGYEMEAIKAQAVVIYTYLKYRDNDFKIDGVKYQHQISQEVKVAVGEVFGRYLSYNGEVALTPFFEMAAGATADASMALSGSYPYLKSVSRIDGERDASNEEYQTTVSLKRGEIQGILLESGFEIDVNSDPANWIVINRNGKDNAVSSSVGYVKSVKVGGQDITGYEFVSRLPGIGLRSNCFTRSYDSATETFTFTCYGIGYGIGMSKAGANALADKGYNYEKILNTYFASTTLSKEENI